MILQQFSRIVPDDTEIITVLSGADIFSNSIENSRG